MLSLASLLNPAEPGSLPASGVSPASGFHPSPVSASSTPATSYTEDPLLDHQVLVRQHRQQQERMASRDSGRLTKATAKGSVNFLPFESLNVAALAEVRKFKVYPLGKIRDSCRHIPYNSGKKDFFEKTGRESFEVFQYIFKIPGDDSDYTVMWDYNIGLVRMTPFFKCCKYSKTTPAKMLNLNPGLRDITHSITGGSIMAQGYWMPFACAKAICATFCHHIAGALIPIFGSHFPSECIPPDGTGHGRMIISPAVVAESTREAERFRQEYTSLALVADSGIGHHSPAGSSLSATTSPQQRRPLDQNRRARFRRPVIGAFDADGNSPYETDTDGESPSSGDVAGLGLGLPPLLHQSSSSRYLFEAIPPLRNTSSSTGWTAANQHRHNNPNINNAHQYASFHHEEPYPGNADPWLSAVPRFTGNGLTTHSLPHHDLLHRGRRPLPSHSPHSPHAPGTPPGSSGSWSSGGVSKRLADVDYSYTHGYRHEDDYDAGESSRSASGSASSPTTNGREGEADETSPGDHPAGGAAVLAPSARGGRGGSGGRGGRGFGSGVDKNAAMLLMHLSVRDKERKKDANTNAFGFPGGCNGAVGGGRDVFGSRERLDSFDLHRSKRRRATSM